MKKYDYKKLPPFKGMVLQNFPFIEEDFDAITNYQLLCKVVEYLNIIAKNNDELIDNIEYLNNWFDNLDVQDEINNKLDEMADSGELQTIILNYLNIEKTYNTLQDMIEDTALVEGQKVKVYSHSILNDGGGGYFLISDTGNISLSNGLKATPIYNFMNNYYDEITVVKERHFDTDCYFTTIPKYDKYGNLIKLYVGYGDGKNPLEYADYENTDVTINGSLYISQGHAIPTIISNGEIIRDRDMVGIVPDNLLYVGIKADRTIVDFPVNTTTGEQMLASGCEQVIDAYWKLVDNGLATDLTGIYNNEGMLADSTQSPRQTIGVKQDGTIIILTCDGRTDSNIGLYCHEAQQLLIQKGCINAWNLDGGGSTSTVIKGTKINRNIDDNGTTVRYIPYTLNVKKGTVNKEIADVYSQIGKVRQETIYQVKNDITSHKLSCQMIIDPFTIDTDDTYTPLHFETDINGSVYSKEHIILTKENEEDTFYTKFRINKKGYFKITTYIGMISRTASSKYLKTTRVTTGYNLPGSTINNESTSDSAQRMFISNQAFLILGPHLEFDYSVLIQGKDNDAITEGCIIIEEI